MHNVKPDVDTQTAVDTTSQVSDNQSLLKQTKNVAKTPATPEGANKPQATKSILHDFNLEKSTQAMKTSSNKVTMALVIIALVAGIGTGFGGYKLQAKSSGLGSGNQPIQQVAGEEVKKGDIFGVHDTSTFKDTAQGYLEAGGLDGEGSHRLLRPGGDSQTVYLTSSVTDLDKLVGMEVKIWGETFKAQKAGWLMDVGRVEVLNTSGTPPSEE